jgi:hypothetical protein
MESTYLQVRVLNVNVNGSRSINNNIKGNMKVNLEVSDYDYADNTTLYLDILERWRIIIEGTSTSFGRLSSLF